MVLIPPEVGVRLRLPSDTGLAPTTPIAEIPSDLPDLKQGQFFSARIQEVLPENTYKALVAGRQMTLSLPEGASAGDILELVVVDRTPRLIIARQHAAPEGAAGHAPYPYTTLSPTGQMIGRLLTEQPAQPAIPLNRGAPLLPAPPPPASPASGQLATALASAVANSGMFYEAHQAQWVAGKRPLPTLLQEPQAQFGAQREAIAAVQSGQTAGTSRIASLLQLTPAQENTAASRSAEAAVSAANSSQSAATIPDELRPLVQQQLEAAANQRLMWHGELWPGQPMEWEIKEEPQNPEQEVQEAAWNTTLRLDTPRLGSIEARLRLSGNNLQLTLSTPFGASAADLHDELPALAAALGAAGLTLQTAQVRHESKESAE